MTFSELQTATIDELIAEQARIERLLSTRRQLSRTANWAVTNRQDAIDAQLAMRQREIVAAADFSARARAFHARLRAR